MSVQGAAKAGRDGMKSRPGVKAITREGDRVLDSGNVIGPLRSKTPTTPAPKGAKYTVLETLRDNDLIDDHTTQTVDFSNHEGTSLLFEPHRASDPSIDGLIDKLLPHLSLPAPSHGVTPPSANIGISS